ncbi:lysine 2,3-aminomutase [Prosthecochloris sp. ZM]|uniref:L-lysine 2,3-aminomutase n=1 Tax=Prosthecochloris aestuarii (strain DSM 271 / SK 413) TaxID=290512 RepID=B4S711_PROA2|nr:MULTISPECIES: lysine 2,3-aminomutase [Prosthecochloris]ACF45848.1 lysine 2,3-aminomutase YodO family protein [Prosthecochloris aestuarii DSM 271]RDD30640.1 lysine 2,3-aminomutase [Prosthecochloris sp. ZM]
MPLSPTQEQIINSIDNEATSSHWKDWKWQMRNSIRDLDTFETLLNITLSPDQRNVFNETVKKFPMSITPYYLSLINTSDMENDPVFRQSVPSHHELDIMKGDMADPLHEDQDSPAPCVTHRYPDRVLLLVSNTCPMYCRHCTRKRKVGDQDTIPTKTSISKGIDYIRSNPAIRDVLLSGGDPFLLPDDYLDWILEELRKIEHVEIIRIGTRTPVVLPYRITPELVQILRKHQPVWVNTHFNHSREMTQSARNALSMLADGGIPLGNQTVLLSGINDCPRIMKALVHQLVKNRVRPYYLYQCDLSEGLSHFRTPVGKGIEILESLIGHTSGFCVPTYVIDAPGGGGKIPVMPNYLISWSTNKVVLRNYEGVITTYKEPDSYEPTFCDRNCDSCDLLLKLEDADETKAIGIEQLLSDHDQTISLVPASNARHSRRKAEQ